MMAYFEIFLKLLKKLDLIGSRLRKSFVVFKLEFSPIHVFQLGVGVGFSDFSLSFMVSFGHFSQTL